MGEHTKASVELSPPQREECQERLRSLTLVNDEVARSTQVSIDVACL